MNIEFKKQIWDFVQQCAWCIWGKIVHAINEIDITNPSIHEDIKKISLNFHLQNVDLNFLFNQNKIVIERSYYIYEF